jgi:mono/diheme cytochrome c family protein
MMTALKIFGFTILVVAFYSYVGQMVPQKETYPPEDTEMSADMTTEDLVVAGEELVSGKGTCLGCHTMSGETGGRFPDLANVGAVAGDRKQGMDDVEYLAESLYDPNVFVVEGFLPGMPPASQPPIDLNDREILAVIAYLQSLGGTPTVTLDTELSWQSEDLSESGSSAASATGGGQAATGGPAQTATTSLTGEELFQTYLCGTCHSISEPTPMIGPSLVDVGARLSKAEIYEAVMDPDATIAEGFAPGMMSAQLNATGFYERVSSQQLRTLVDFLASMEGGS